MGTKHKIIIHDSLFQVELDLTDRGWLANKLNPIPLKINAMSDLRLFEMEMQLRNYLLKMEGGTGWQG